MKIAHVLSAYRWPIFLGGILAMSIVANGILVYVATRPDTPAPIPGFYEKSLEWEADEAQLAASRRLGWTVTFEVPTDEVFAMAERRPVDITVSGRDDAPVTGLTGRLVAVRPADTRLNGESELFELPQAPGHYRTLARLPIDGLWELSLDAHSGETPFLCTERVTVGGARTP